MAAKFREGGELYMPLTGKGETPAEIAVAIAAEIIAVRRGADTASISSSSRERIVERLIGDRSESGGA